MRAASACLCALLLTACSPEETAGQSPRTASSPAASPAPTQPLDQSCNVLCVSDFQVKAGDVVAVTFDPPPRLTWGVSSQVWRILDDGSLDLLASLYGWNDDKRLRTLWPPAGGGEDVGFNGPARWLWRVPRRLDPGVYQIRKETIGPGSRPVEERTTTWTVDFEVVEGP